MTEARGVKRFTGCSIGVRFIGAVSVNAVSPIPVQWAHLTRFFALRGALLWFSRDR